MKMKRFLMPALLVNMALIGHAMAVTCDPAYGLDANGNEQAPSECATTIYTFDSLPASVSAVRGTVQSFKGPDNITHWYEAVYLPQGGLNWLQVKALAVEAGGYLASITSDEENTFVFNLISDPKFWWKWDSTHNYVMSGPFLGGFQPGGSPEPAGGWKWVTGENFSFTKWCKDGIPGDTDPRDNTQPNDGGGTTGSQDVLAFGEVNIPVSYWGDFPHTISGLNDQGSNTKVYGFIIKYNTQVATVTRTLTVTKTGSGTVTSNPAGISCDSDCSESYNSGTSVTLTATPAAGFTFAGWGGDCSGTTSCTLSMTAAKNVSATFTSGTFSLSVSKVGTGTVTSTPSGINCGTGSDCLASFASGTSVTLTANPATATFSGGCTGTGTCTLSMNAAKTVTATFSGGTVENNDVVVLQHTNPAVTGAGSGDDIYILTPYLLTGTESITLSDAQGSNRLQLVGGLAIAKSDVAATALRLTLTNGAVITVLGADAFQYDVGGDAVAGINHTPVTFAAFSQNTLGVMVPATGTAAGGAVTIPNP
ncbi:exported hypothetical protein [Gammaproteobacteria bacterium]